MMESNEEGPPPDAAVVNPFDSPGIEPHAEAASDEVGELSPTPAMLWGGLLLGLLIQTVATLSQIRLFLDDIPMLLAWCLPPLITGLVIGLGIALLCDVWRHRKFSALMPGHWCVIAYLPLALAEFLLAMYGFGIDLLPGAASEVLMTNYIVAMAIGMAITAGLVVAFYCAVLKTTREQTTWKTFAYSSIVSWLCFCLFVMARQYGLGEVNELANTVLGMLTGASYLAATITFLIGVIVDYTRRRPRDAYHWMGLILMVAMPCSHLPLRLLPQAY